jgi:hypothetical protein
LFLKDSDSDGIVSLKEEDFYEISIKNNHEWIKIFASGYSGTGAIQRKQYQLCFRFNYVVGLIPISFRLISKGFKYPYHSFNSTRLLTFVGWACVLSGDLRTFRTFIDSSQAVLGHPWNGNTVFVPALGSIEASRIVNICK